MIGGHTELPSQRVFSTKPDKHKVRIVACGNVTNELHALAFARKSARDFRLLIRESFAITVTVTNRCDNTAAIAMLDEPGWTKYISIYGEAAR